MSRELTLFREEHLTSRAAAARRLRELADKIEATQFQLGDHNVALPESIRLKIEVNVEDEEGEIEIELHWEASDAMPHTPFGAQG